MCLLCDCFTGTAGLDELGQATQLTWRQWFYSWGPWLQSKWQQLISGAQARMPARQACANFARRCGLNLLVFNMRAQETILNAVIIYMAGRFFANSYFNNTFGSRDPDLFNGVPDAPSLRPFWQAPDTAIMTAAALTLYMLALPLKRILAKESQKAIEQGMFSVHIVGLGIVYGEEIDPNRSFAWRAALLVLSAPPVISLIFHIIGRNVTSDNLARYAKAIEIGAGKEVELHEINNPVVKVANAITSTSTSTTLMGAAMVAYTVSVIQEFYNGSHASDLSDQAQIMKIMGIIGLIYGAITNLADKLLAQKIPQTKWLPYVKDLLELFLSSMFAYQAFFMTYEIYQDSAVLDAKGYRADSLSIHTGYAFSCVSVIMAVLTQATLPKLKELKPTDPSVVSNILALTTGIGAVPKEYGEMTWSELRAALKEQHPGSENIPNNQDLQELLLPPADTQV
jgi:hypothetical protein